jgi:two-component system response regulator HydG
MRNLMAELRERIMNQRAISSFSGEQNYKPPVLIVDDDRDTCELLCCFLSPDFLCDTAYDGEQALHGMTDKDYSVILVDLMLPKVDGFTLIKSAAQNLPAAPVIVVSAVAEVQAAIQAMKVGAFAYIVKPFEPEQVEISVKRAFNHHLTLQSQLRFNTPPANARRTA